VYPRPPLASAGGAAATSGEPDLYAVLGVARDAEREVVDAAYRALARKYHPDVNRAPDAAGRTRALNEAYRVLHDEGLRAEYDARRRGGVARRRVVAGEDRPLDLFGAALADAWRRLDARARVVGWGARRAASGASAGETTATMRTRRAWVGPAVALAAGLATGVWVIPRFSGGRGRALAGYWRSAAEARARVAEARVRYSTQVAPGYAAVVATTSCGPVAMELIAALDAGSGRLRAVGAVPAEAEAYHFLQLDDWREERDLRVVQRDAIQSRNPDLWAAAQEREVAWRGSGLHERAETAAAQLAVVAGR